MSGSQVLFSAQVVAILATLLLAVGYLKNDPKAPSTRVFAVMILFIVFYILTGMGASHVDPAFQLDLSRVSLLFNTGMNSISGLFMVYCFLVFQEGQRFPRWLAFIFGTQVILDFTLTVIAILFEGGAVNDSPLPWVSTGLDVLQLSFVGLAIYWTMKGWRADLVQDRRALRWFIIGIQGWLIFLVTFAENFLLSTSSESYATAQLIIVCSIALIALGMVIATMEFDPVSLSRVIKKVAELREETDEEESSSTFNRETFDRKFRDGHLYREAGLTIAVLAKKLSLPEYRLRSFIHKELGFRNFNAMLHQYRVEEASEALADHSRQNVPVLTIALSVGYQSITPFNNAFRTQKGLTPSEYRKQALGKKGKITVN